MLQVPSSFSSASELFPSTLSICMIVKNEEKVLSRCLESVKSIADEIIVADTGSTDSTPAIARSYGATVISSPWRNDFSHARNASIAPARGSWILWLDADDFVPAKSAQEIAKLKQEPPSSVWIFTVRNEKPGGTGSEFKQARMFPNRPELRFERRIHEQISLSALRIGIPLVERDVLIVHYGYGDPSSVIAKAQRNIEMLLAECDLTYPDAIVAIELADAYLITGDSASAEKWYRMALMGQGVEATLPDAASHAHLGIGKVCNEKGEYAEAQRHLQASLRLCPKRPDALYSLAVTLEKLGNIGGAIENLYAIVRATNSRPLFVSVDFREARLKAYLRLERLLCQTQRFSEAEALAAEAAELLPEQPQILSMHGRAHMRSNRLLQALHAFEKSFHIAPGGNIDAFIGLCFVYLRANRAATARDTLRQIRPQFETHPRFWAALRVLFGECAGEAPKAVEDWKIGQEEAYLRAVFATAIP